MSITVPYLILLVMVSSLWCVQDETRCYEKAHSFYQTSNYMENMLYTVLVARSRLGC